ncbi:DUF2997 domain-containing protein [Methanoregula sp.]|uniref:DUF2997 domain-containing protein n=1 Tax=Methanoregula sp. TaxID=2052170 RepID=UPI003566D2F5
MEMQELEITIDKNGMIQIAVKGVHGAGCDALTKDLEDVIGTVEERTYTAEYYEQPGEVQNFQYQNLR